MSAATISMLPCKVRMESCKIQPPAALCFNPLVISKHNRKHQIRRNQKLQSLATDLIRKQKTDRYKNMVVCSSIEPGPSNPSNPNPGPGNLVPEEVEIVMNAVEAVADLVKIVAEQVEKVADDIGDHLTEGRLKDAFEFVEDLADDTGDRARLAGEFIGKVFFLLFN
ncbi:hypothetical protein DITRI_Ditri03aG0168000 [Diplodiscus trichospermus]